MPNSKYSKPLWRLPDYLSDILPTEARQLEALRYQALELLRTWGYEMVTPPLLESLESLTTGTAHDLHAQMFKVVDPLTDTLLGIRADVTPQIARIDAHVLNRNSPTRLCYSVPAVRSVVGDAFSQREVLQLGAELFGYAGIEADTEIQALALTVLNQLGTYTENHTTILTLSHSGILKALFDIFPQLQTCKQIQVQLITALKMKHKTALIELCEILNLQQAQPVLLSLIQTYGEFNESLYKTLIHTTFKDYPALINIIENLYQLKLSNDTHYNHLNLNIQIMLDLADLTGYEYHTGVQFAVYVKGLNTALIKGGRYDAVGEVFGRVRAATGFSLDLRTLASLLPVQPPSPAIIAPFDNFGHPFTPAQNQSLNTEIRRLRLQGEVVVYELPHHNLEHDEFLCNRRLILDTNDNASSSKWVIQAV